MVLFLKVSMFTNKCKCSCFQLVPRHLGLRAPQSFAFYQRQNVALTELFQPLLRKLSTSVVTCWPIPSPAHFGRALKYFAKIQGSQWKSIIFLTISWHCWETKASVGCSRPKICSRRTRDNLKLGHSELGLFLYYSVRKERNYRDSPVLGRKECVRYLLFWKTLVQNFLSTEKLYFPIFFTGPKKYEIWNFIVE